MTEMEHVLDTIEFIATDGDIENLDIDWDWVDKNPDIFGDDPDPMEWDGPLLTAAVCGLTHEEAVEAWNIYEDTATE